MLSCANTALPGASPGGKQGERSPSKPGKFPTDWEKPTPHPEMRIDSFKNLNFR